jgi:hypothetical protein
VVDDPSLLRGTWETKTGGRVGSETGLMAGLWERLRARWANVGETGEDVGVFRRTKVEMGMFADDSGSLTCLCFDSGPSFKAEGLWRGEAVTGRLGRSGSVPSLESVEAVLRWECEMGAP